MSHRNCTIYNSNNNNKKPVDELARALISIKWPTGSHRTANIHNFLREAWLRQTLLLPEFLAEWADIEVLDVLRYCVLKGSTWIADLGDWVLVSEYDFEDCDVTIMTS